MDSIDVDRFSENSESISDDSDMDPNYSELEETRSKFSNLYVTKKSNSSAVEEADDGIEIVDVELEEVDQKSFEEVQRIVGAGKIEKLKVEQCKVYLRKNGLRLMGNKATLIQRIKEHLEISNGGGEKKYPVSSFVMNCKGDACTGDVVLFEQKVYDMYNIVSRSASGPPCGTRMVAGRIVNESYGSAKQQHTFTVEVLWSKGEKPLPPLHPLLIKGRNLYRLKTLRQKWEDEEERQKMLMEKHERGSLARSNREARIEEKEKRKMHKKTNRVSKREPNRNQPEFDSTSVSKPSLQPLQSSLSADSGLVQHKHTDQAPQRLAGYRSFDKRDNTLYSGVQEVQHTDDHIDGTTNFQRQTFTSMSNQPYSNYKEYHHSWGGRVDGATKFHEQPSTSMNNRPMSPVNRQYNVNNYRPISPPRRQHDPRNLSRQYCDDRHHPTSPSRRHYHNNNNRPMRQHYDNNDRPMSPSRRQYYFCDNNYRPVSPSRRQCSDNNYRPTSPSMREYVIPRKPCHYFARGTCRFGESCKFSHDER